MSDFSDFISDAGSTIVANVPDGMDAQLAVSVARDSDQGVVFVARDEQRLAQFADYVRFFAPELDVLSFPAWDCLPYDRASPNRAVVAQRMSLWLPVRHVPWRAGTRCKNRCKVQ